MDRLRDDLNRFTTGEEIAKSADELNMIGRVQSMHGYLESMFLAEAKWNQRMQKLTMDILNLHRNTDISPANRARLQEKASLDLSKLLGEEKTGTMSLDELILEVNETSSWNAAKNLIKGLQNQIDITMAQHDKLNLKPTEQEAFERLADDKKIHHSSETIQTIGQRYGLMSLDSPNEISQSIISHIVDNKNSSNMIAGLTKKVFKQIGYLKAENSEKARLKGEWDQLKYGLLIQF